MDRFSVKLIKYHDNSFNEIAHNLYIGGHSYQYGTNFVSPIKNPGVRGVFGQVVWNATGILNGSKHN